MPRKKRGKNANKKDAQPPAMTTVTGERLITDEYVFSRLVACMHVCLSIELVYFVV